MEFEKKRKSLSVSMTGVTTTGPREMHIPFDLKGMYGLGDGPVAMARSLLE